MKKILSTIVLLTILVIGLATAFSYKAPETKAYITLNEIDTQIDQSLEVSEQSMTENLNALQAAVYNLITIGETYTEGTDVQPTLEQFNTAYQNSKTLQSKLSELTTKDLTAKLKNTTDKLSDEQKKLADEAINLETARVDQLNGLFKEIETLNSKLATTEEMFYTKKPSEAIQYFNEINNEFSNLEQTYKKYADASTNYFTAKSNLFEAITE